MLVPSALRSNSTSSTEHNAYLASLLLLQTADEAGSEAAPPAESAGSGGGTAPPAGNGINSSSGSSLSPVKAFSWERSAFRGTRKFELEMIIKNLEAEIVSLVLEILGVERGVEEVRECIASGSAYRGRQGEALGAVEGKLASKELLLREKEKQLRDEKMVLLRSLQGSNDDSQQRKAYGTTTTTDTTRHNEGISGDHS